MRLREALKIAKNVRADNYRVGNYTWEYQDKVKEALIKIEDELRKQIATKKLYDRMKKDWPDYNWLWDRYLED